jgi:hypothetical protein
MTPSNHKHPRGTPEGAPGAVTPEGATEPDQNGTPEGVSPAGHAGGRDRQPQTSSQYLPPKDGDACRTQASPTHARGRAWGSTPEGATEPDQKGTPEGAPQPITPEGATGI